MLLVHHHQAQVAELHVVRQQPVGADHDVRPPARQRLAGPLDLPGRRQAGQRDDFDRFAREALRQRLPVLLAQHGGRHQECDLPAGGDGQEGRAGGDLGLAEADVAAHQAVHRTGPAHVRQHFFGGAALVRRVLERKARLELFVAGVGSRKLEPRQRLARGDHRHQLVGHVLHRPAGAALALGPARSAEPVERRGRLVGVGIALHLAKLRDRDVELVAAREAQQQELLFHAPGHQLGEPAIAADPVLGVDQQIVDLDLGQAVDGLAAARGAHRAPTHARAEDVLLGQQHQPLAGPVEALGELRGRHIDLAGVRPRVQRRPRRRGERQLERVVPQDVDQTFRRRGRGAQQAHAAAGLGPVRQPVRERLQGAPRAAPRLDLPPQPAVVRRAQVLPQLLGVGARRTQRVQQDRPARQQQVAGVVAAQVERIRVRYQPVLQSGPLAAGPDLLAEFRPPLSAGLGVVDHDQGGIRHVVEHPFHALVQQRLQVLDARGRVLAPQRLGQRVDIGLGDARFAPQLAHALHQRVGRVRQAERARGDRHHVVEFVPGALGGRIERPHRADLAIVEFDAHRALELGRKQIEDASAGGDLAALLHQRGVVVAGRDQHVEQRVPVDRHAPLQVGRAAAQLGAGRDEPQQRRQGSDEGERAVRRGSEQRIESAHAPRLDLRMGGEAVVGRGVVAREKTRPDARGEYLQRGGEFAGARGRGADQQQDSGVAPAQPADQVGARGPPRPAQTQSSPALERAVDQRFQQASLCLPRPAAEAYAPARGGRFPSPGV